MEWAVCVRCGLMKRQTFSVCLRCKLDPAADDETMARSIRLSTRYQLADGEHLSMNELQAASEQIERGEFFEFKKSEIDALLEEKRLLDAGLPVLDKVKIALFLLVLFVPVAVGILALMLN